MFTPELNASEQKRMAGSYNGHNDAGSGSKKPKLSPEIGRASCRERV